jgi:glycosyltransferase involved in cell wall biosynthesis
MDYIVVTNTFKRSLQLVTRSIKSSLNQKTKPIKIILIDQNEQPLHLTGDITGNKLFERKIVDTTSVSVARNSLVIPENAEWIVFCDDDGFLHPDYSELLLNKINSNPGIDILAGNIIREDTKTNYTLRQKNFGSLKYFRNTKKLMGSNFVVRAKVFEELKRFDENFGAGSYWGSGEETDFCWKAFFAKKRMEFFPDLIVYHIPPFYESIKTGFKKSFRYGVGKGALVWKWLFKKKKIIVAYELFEMLIIPFGQFFRGIFTLRPQLIPTHFAALVGRIYGLCKAAFVFKESD